MMVRMMVRMMGGVITGVMEDAANENEIILNAILNK